MGANTLNKTATPAELPPVAAEPTIAVANASKSTWHTMLENPLQSLLTALVVALLAFSFTSFNINIGRLDNRINRLDDSIATLDNKLDGMNLRLTALIAHLGSEPPTKLT